MEIGKILDASTVKLQIVPHKLFGNAVQTLKGNSKNSREAAKLASVLRSLEGAKRTTSKATFACLCGIY